MQNPDEALTLARRIAAATGLSFAGLMTYPAAGKVERMRPGSRRPWTLLTRAGLRPQSFPTAARPIFGAPRRSTAATEHRPGTYIYSDRYQVAKGVGTWADCALTVLATVVSRPTPMRAVIDAGSEDAYQRYARSRRLWPRDSNIPTRSSARSARSMG